MRCASFCLQVPCVDKDGQPSGADADAVGGEQNQLRASLAEEMRIRHALQMHDSVINKNREELNRYRAHLETRDEEMRKIMRMEDERMQVLLRVCVLFVGTHFSNLNTAVDTPARAA
jgi:hypothetical protein